MSEQKTISTLTEPYFPSPPNFGISDEIKERIVRNYIEPNYQYDIKKLLEGKRSWKLVGQIFETISKAFVAIGGIVSFAAGSYGDYNLSFVAGAISTISLATLSFSSFGYKEQKKQGLELNNLLKKLKLDDVPLNERSVDDIGSGNYYQARSSSAYQTVKTPQQVIYVQDPYANERADALQKENEIKNLKLLEIQRENYLLKTKEKPYYNNLEQLKIHLEELSKKNPNEIPTVPNTPREDKNWLTERIGELSKDEEKIEVNIHPEDVQN